MLLIAALIIAASYFLGSIPFGYLVAKLLGVDIRKHGSGNIGATNVFRILGPRWGVLVFFLDCCKGYGAVKLAFWINHAVPLAAFHSGDPGYIVELPPVLAEILAAIWVVVGHSFPVWLFFKGGKGVATSAGVMLALVAPATLCSLGVWILLFFTTRYVSVASLGGVLVLPAAVWFFAAPGDRGPLLCLAAVICFLVIWRHRTNIRRLIEGREHRFTRAKPSRE